MRLTVAVAWNRLFDFGMVNDTAHWMFFSPSGWNETSRTFGTRFEFSTALTPIDAGMMLSESIAVGNWHHVVLVVSPPDLLYYLDGIEKFRATNSKNAPKHLGVTNRNWIGRSAFSTDAYLSADVDELKVFEGGLMPADVATLRNQ